jgi:hypothetical protein
MANPWNALLFPYYEFVLAREICAQEVDGCLRKMCCKKTSYFQLTPLVTLNPINQNFTRVSISKSRLPNYVQILLDVIGHQVIIHNVQHGMLFEDLANFFLHIGCCSNIASEIF